MVVLKPGLSIRIRIEISPDPEPAIRKRIPNFIESESNAEPDPNRDTQQNFWSQFF
jgi:hypothetical protein